jgi:K+-transporting ATPase KdpF subunit
VGSFAFVKGSLDLCLQSTGQASITSDGPPGREGREALLLSGSSEGLLNRLIRGDFVSSYVLLAIVIGLVIYLFYAVINPERF